MLLDVFGILPTDWITYKIKKGLLFKLLCCCLVFHTECAKIIEHEFSSVHKTLKKVYTLKFCKICVTSLLECFSAVLKYSKTNAKGRFAISCHIHSFFDKHKIYFSNQELGVFRCVSQFIFNIRLSLKTLFDKSYCFSNCWIVLCSLIYS